MRRTKRKATLASLRMVATMVAPLWMLPAMWINIDWSAGALAPWNLAAAAAIAAAALFVAAASLAKSRAAAVAFSVAATLLIVNNILIAFTSASHRSFDGRDLRASQIATIERLKSQRSQLLESRKSAASVVGELPAASIEAQVDQAVASDARRWRVTNHCDPASVTAPASMVFCGNVALLRGRLAAASKRDALSAQIERIDAEVGVLAAPASADPFADAIGNLTAAVGLPLSKTVAEALPAMRDALRSLVLELIAALGPAAWLMLWTKPTVRRPSTPTKQAAISPKKGAAPDATKGGNVLAFISERVERDTKSTLRAGQMWDAWRAWCAERSIDPGSQKTFGLTVGQQFTRRRNNGRPLYVGARLRASQQVQVIPFARPRRFATS